VQAPRKIIHVDADSFYASVEMREDPALANLPIAVGGRSERRGVISTANYLAREFGVHSAMASARAKALCPQLVILPPRFELYRAVSAQFHDIFRDYTDLVEPLSLDEAFLDVTQSSHCGGSATLIAREIRQRVRETLNLTVSAGIAPNKFLAKVASDWDKPDGQYTIAPDDVAEFVIALPVSKINGVGKVMTSKLAQLGVQTCGDLQNIPLEQLVLRFGKYGKRLSEVSHGIDNRPVVASRTRKSISVERTFSQDIEDISGVQQAFPDLLAELDRRFSKISQKYLPTKRFVKVKYHDFTQTTLEEALNYSGTVPTAWADPAAYERLVEEAWQRAGLPVRLLGAGLRLQPSQLEASGQLGLFDDIDESVVD
jgi:DNA polymerase-4